MLCKWCGADVPNSETKCPRCKRDMTAKSDCGGFYDIVSAPKKAEPTGFQPATTEIIRERFVPQPTKNNLNLVQLALSGVACLGLLFALIQLSSISKKVNETSATANQAGQQATQIIQELRRVRGDSEYQIHVAAERGQNGNNVKTSVELGNYNSMVNTKVTTDEETGDISKVQVGMGETDDAVVAKIKKSTAEGETTIAVSTEVDADLFDAERSENAVSYRWECKLGNRWVELTDEQLKELFTISEDGTSITIKNKELSKVLELAGEDALVELSVTCTRINVKEESLEIKLIGISLEKPEIEASGEEEDVDNKSGQDLEADKKNDKKQDKESEADKKK